MEKYFYNTESKKVYKIPIVDRSHPFSMIINNSIYGTGKVVKEITKEEYIRLLKIQ